MEIELDKGLLNLDPIGFDLFLQLYYSLHFSIFLNEEKDKIKNKITPFL